MKKQTKENEENIKKRDIKGRFIKGNLSWNIGLTKETDKRIKDTSKKISETRKRLFKEERIIHPKGMANKKHSDKTKLKMRKSNKSYLRKGKTREEIYSKKSIDSYNNARHPKPKWLIKISKNKKGKTFDEIYGKEKAEKIMNDLKERGHYQKISQQMRDGRWLIARIGNLKLPNRPETTLINLIKENNLPFIYVGNNQFWIKGENQYYNPDFINKEQKLIIEIFGRYWHSGDEAFLRDEQKLLEYFKQGYLALIIWDYELKNLNLVLEKIYNFLKCSKYKVKDYEIEVLR